MAINFKADNFDLNNEIEKIKRDVRKPNILICGATGVGKSSFINDVFGKKVALVGEGIPITKGIQRYERKDLSVVLYDSEGYEVGEEKQSYFKEEIIGVIDKYRNENASDLYNQIHEVWYFISAANKRVTETDIEVVNLIKSKNVPVAIVITQIDNVDEDELNEIIRVIQNDFLNIKYFTTCVTDNEEIAKAVEPYNQKDELLDWALDNLDKSLKDGFVISIKNNLIIKRKHIEKNIIPIYVASAGAAALIPLPMADSAALMPIQMAMTAHIMNAYGIDEYKGVAGSIVSSTIIATIGKSIARTLAGNILKFIPAFGQAVGMAINASVAGALTASIGYAITLLCYEYSKAIIDGKDISLIEVFTSDAIKNAMNKSKESRSDIE